ncbi:MAG: hypothetical protein CM15mP45_10460 [Deltaproteobacteria bacterium]|nr:MAG: hypothetical protein CM15mP45_10460 [Deltaproteobacteria bacterium]
MPIDNVSIGGSFSSNVSGSSSTLVGTLNHTGSGDYNDIEVTYQAPGDNSSCFKPLILKGPVSSKTSGLRVSNLQEIGVTAHFTIYITDNTSIESPDSNDNVSQNFVDTNPTPYELTGERTGKQSGEIQCPCQQRDGFADYPLNGNTLILTGGSKNLFRSGYDR